MKLLAGMQRDVDPVVRAGGRCLVGGRFGTDAVSGEPAVRLALRVEDVGAAAWLYQGFGFVLLGEVPGPDGVVVMAILRRGPLQLLVDALVGLPFADSARERHTQIWPRGLGVVIGIEVDDVDEAAQECRAAGCVITAGPLDAPWGERYVEFEDPYGYGWKFFKVRANAPDDGLRAAGDLWFGQVGLSPSNLPSADAPASQLDLS